MARVAVVGAGIVGLAVAAQLAGRGDEVVVLEKERAISQHQTGRNSGVIHSGLYYTPGSAKAVMSAAGQRSMKAFAADRGIGVATCGKLVVATEERELDGLRRLERRAADNNIPARWLEAAEARELEPGLRAVAALRVETTGIVDYPAVCQAFADDVAASGEVRLGESFVGARTAGSRVVVETGSGTVEVDAMVACAGLQSDRVARASGVEPGARIVPFRGEYFELKPESRHLVNGLIYPVPDPRFPFLGVHLTRGIHGEVHAGPNAVLALAREGYEWSDVNLRDMASALAWPGMWRLGARNLVPGAKEVGRSLSRKAFARSLARLIPAITVDDLIPAPAGVRAQALQRDGGLVDDFLIRSAPRQVHVINAPSPAATASLEIAKVVVQRLDEAIGA